jgi:hypothetical protein
MLLLQMTIGSVTIRFSHKFPDPTPASDAAADKKVERHKEGRQQFVDDFVSGVCAPPPPHFICIMRNLLHLWCGFALLR